MPELNISFMLLLFLVAFLYASVGHGGASGYLALMGFFSISHVVMRPSALVLNVFVSAVAFFEYYRKNNFRWKLFWPFAAGSVPAALMGAMVTVDAIIYKRLLGIILLFSVVRLLGWIGKESRQLSEVKIIPALIIGMTIGFLSGILGIGGGILLSPVILLAGWADMKKTACVSALFILVNSLTGLITLFAKGVTIQPIVYAWLLVALTGGFAGAYLGSHKFDNRILRKLLAVVLVIASIKLLVS